MLDKYIKELAENYALHCLDTTNDTSKRLSFNDFVNR